MTDIFPDVVVRLTEAEKKWDNTTQITCTKCTKVRTVRAQDAPGLSQRGF